jgi:hypothetical protein
LCFRLFISAHNIDFDQFHISRKVFQAMMFSFNNCHFVLFSFLSISATSAQVAVDLGTAADFVILAKTGISSVPTSSVTGDIGVSPIDASAMTGFDLTADSSGTFSTSSQVIGMCYASDYVSPTPSELTTAVSDMETAYTAAAGQPTTGANLNLGGSAGIGGMTLTPGVYTFDVDVLVNSDMYFDGSENDVFIVQTTGSLDVANGKKVTLLNGAKAYNIFWQVAGDVRVGTTAHMEGVLLVMTKAVFQTGSSLNGRVLAQTAVTLDSATIVEQNPPARVRAFLRG